jgi:hypothetical protein
VNRRTLVCSLKNDVCQFLINNALYFIGEFQVGGFRQDEISVLISMNCDSSWTFCSNLTNTLRYVKPRLLENAEFSPGEAGSYPKSWQSIVTPTTAGLLVGSRLRTTWLPSHKSGSGPLACLLLGWA